MALSNASLAMLLLAEQVLNAEGDPPLDLTWTEAENLVTVNSSGCSNEYCDSDEEYVDRIRNYIYPTQHEWALIAFHLLVFVVGLVGNFLVCMAVYRNQTMRTVTNIFIVNLAVADFLVILLCLPPTVLWDVTETWFMGDALCKVIPYFQTVSVSVSVMTLTFISIDRWYAICFPLKFRSTIGRAKTAIAVIWIFSLLIDVPELVVLRTRPRPNITVDTVYLTDCDADWSEDADLAYQSIKATLLYALPLLFMSVTYYQIVRVLWRSANVAVVRGSGAVNVSAVNSNKELISMNTNSSTEMQLRSRRKAAKMLVVVVVMFGMCYFPVHLISILRYAVVIPQNDFTVAAALISHWLCYFNSAINPVIYNFMSGKFRKEFRRAARCWCGQRVSRTMTASWTMRESYAPSTNAASMVLPTNSLADGLRTRSSSTSTSFYDKANRKENTRHVKQAASTTTTAAIEAGEADLLVLSGNGDNVSPAPNGHHSFSTSGNLSFPDNIVVMSLFEKESGKT